MKEKDAKELSILRVAVIDEDTIYQVAKSWADGHDIDITETETKSKGSLNWKWEGKKNHNEYIQSKYEIKVSIDDRVPVELVEGDKKVKKTKAKVKVEIKSIIVTDRQKKWEGSDFMKKIEEFYNNYLDGNGTRKHKKEIEAWSDELYDNFKTVLGVDI